MIYVSHFVTDWSWRIRLGKIPPIPCDGPLVLYLNTNIQLKVFVPNLLEGAAKAAMGAETAFDTQLRLLLIHNLRLYCKALKTIVNKSVEYNAFRLAQYEYAMYSHDVIRVCLPREHNLITQFQQNLMWCSRSRYVSSKISRRSLISDLGDLNYGNWLS